MMRVWFSIAAIVLGACTVHAKTGAAAMVSLANEKVLLSPFIDSSSLQTLSGWPKDSATRSLLLVHFRELHDALVAEFRRCEKYGYFEVVDDSAAATVRVQCIIRPYSFAKDTLTMPVRIELHHRVGVDTYTNTMGAAGVYKAASKPKSQLHYIDNLLADYRRSFPCRKLVALFYPRR
jgi:hypothetical protein